MAYYIFYRDLQKNRRAPDLSEVEQFCKRVNHQSRIAETNRKEKEKN